MWSENERVGEYRLRERQFRGVASASWLAEAVATGDPVRLANLEVPASLEGMREPIVNAIRQALERSNGLRDIGVVPGTLQIREQTLLTVTPCPEGPPLRRQMQQGWPEGLEAQIVAAASLANIVACAHEHELTHGFLTPESIYLTREGRAQVVEFGIHAPGIGTVWPGPTEANPYWPTDGRLAAEPARRDLYGLGVILYEIFTGQLPPEATGAGDLERLAQALPEKLPRSLPPKIAAAIVQPEEGESITARHLAVQLTFARSWIRAVARGEPAPEEHHMESETVEQSVARVGEASPSQSHAAHPASSAGDAPALQEARIPSPASEVSVPAPVAAPRESPIPFQLPPMIERLPIWAWWAGLSCGLFAAIALVSGLWVGTQWAGGGVPGGGRSERVAGVIETTGAKPLQFDFEDGTAMGWKSRFSGLFVKPSKDLARSGKESLKVRLYRTTAAKPAEIMFLPPASVRAGTRMRMFVMVPYGSQEGLSAKAYVHDANWKWADGGIARVTPGVWTELTVAVPEDAQFPLNAIGVHFEADPAWSGRLYIDDVREVTEE